MAEADLVEVAVSMVRELGSLRALTMRRLAERDATTPTTLYRYFAGREALLRVARRSALAGLRSRLTAAFAHPDLGVALCEWVRCYASGDPLDPGLQSLNPLGETRPADQRDAAAIVGCWALRRGSERGDLDRGLRPEVGALLVWSGAHAILRLRSGDEVEPALVLTVVQGLLSAEAATHLSQWAP